MPPKIHTTLQLARQALLTNDDPRFRLAAIAFAASLSMMLVFGRGAPSTAPATHLIVSAPAQQQPVTPPPASPAVASAPQQIAPAPVVQAEPLHLAPSTSATTAPAAEDSSPALKPSVTTPDN